MVPFTSANGYSRHITLPRTLEGFFGRLKNEFFRGRDWSGVSAAEFARRLDRWMGWYRSGRLREFREGGEVVWDTIDGRRARLGLAV